MLLQSDNNRADRLPMRTQINNFILKNMRPVVITFELFWIIVFLLANATNNASTEMPQFIYVNF